MIAAAIHAGDSLRPEVARHIILSSQQRRREEDPCTGDWTRAGDSRIIVHRSRFEIDLNRPRHRAVYAAPVDCWNLTISDGPAGEELKSRSLDLYDAFYRELFALLERIYQRWGTFLLLDLHAYNHRRSGAGGPPADPAVNPDINVGTAGAEPTACAGLIGRFIDVLRDHELRGRPLDVRTDVNFRGGHLVRWARSNFSNSCSLAVEVKKIYMDELTGRVDDAACQRIAEALTAAAGACRRILTSSASRAELDVQSADLLLPLIESEGS